MLYEETTTGSEISLIDSFLEEQTLTAVEKFARLHDNDQLSRHLTVYQDLIPLEQPGTGQQFAFAVDLDKCSGCKACVTACHNMNGLDADETWRSVGLIHDKDTINQKLIFPQLVLQRFQHKYTSQPISLVEPGRQAFQQNVTTACHHCVEPGCLSGCPVNAYEKDPVTGIVKHLDDQCIGCKYCTLMCPYDVPQYNPKQGIVRKCDMCSSRLATGEAPACVQSCPTRAIRITVVETARVKETPTDFVAMPGVADPQHTYPTTTFKSKRNLLETMQPSDHYFIEPEAPEYPLLFMLILTQLSAGLFLLENILHLFGLDRLSPLLALVALVSGIAGLGVAQLHLGRPLYAFRSFLGLKTSWLSREVVAAGLFVGLAALYTGLLWLPALTQISGVQSALWTPESGGLRTLLGLLVVSSGLLTVSCSAMVYQVTPRPFWRDGSPFVKFFLTTLILGGVTGLLVGALAAAELEAMARPLYGLLIVATAAKLWYEARSFAHAKAVSLTSLKKSALLMQRTLLQATQTRFISAVLGAILLPLALWSNTSETGLVVLTVMMFLLTFTGELLERYLFFSCAVAPRMPGHPVRRRL